MRQRKKFVIAVFIMLLIMIFGGNQVHAETVNQQMQSILVPHEWSPSAGSREVKFSVSERSISLALVTDGFQECYSIGGGNSYVIWMVNFRDGKHEYQLQCRTPYGQAGSYDMDGMNYQLKVKTSSNWNVVTWVGVSCDHSIHENELIWSATLPDSDPAFQDSFDVTQMTITSYSIREYQDPNAPDPNVGEGSAIIRSVQTGFEGNLRLYFNLMFSEEILTDENAYLEIDGEQHVRVLVKDGVPTQSTDGTEERLQFCYPTFADEIRENVVLRVYDGHGNVVKLTNKNGDKDFTQTGFTYSLMTYLKNMMESSDLEMAALARATIDYCTAAQLYFDYKVTEECVLNSDVTAVTEDSLAAYAPVSDGERFECVVKRTLTGSFEADNAIYVSFYLDNPELAADYLFRVMDDKGNIVSESVSYDGGAYRLSVQGLAADMLGQSYLFQMIRKSDEVAWNVKASVLTYARSCIGKAEEHPKRADLGRALYLYSQAANAFFGK